MKMSALFSNQGLCQQAVAYLKTIYSSCIKNTEIKSYLLEVTFTSLDCYFSVMSYDNPLSQQLLQCIVD
jgi:hypothetical protein